MRPLLLHLALLVTAWAEAPPCAPRDALRCASCHTNNLAQVFPERATRPCTAYCTSCHFKEDPKRHHPVGQEMRRTPQHPSLQRTGTRLSCATCHDVGRPRTDTRRWKAASFFDRAFRRQDRYTTYYLVTPNERGQLCKACH